MSDQPEGLIHLKYRLPGFASWPIANRGAQGRNILQNNARGRRTHQTKNSVSQLYFVPFVVVLVFAMRAAR
jgi:hypothetical protein